MNDEPVTCVNCGKQNIIMDDDPYDIKCEYSGRDGIPAHPVRIKFKKEENNMPENMPAQEQNKELPPIPPRPDMAGKNKKQGLMLLHHYYEDNAALIISYDNVKGDKQTREDWGFSNSGWNHFRQRHGLTVGMPRGKGVKRNKKAAPPIQVKPAEAAHSKPPEMDDGVIELEELHQLKLAGLPKFRWYWFPEVQKKWLEIYEKLMLGN